MTIDVKNGKECVILVHGLARSSRSFEKMARTLRSSHYEVINLDYPSRIQSIESLASEFIGGVVRSCKMNKVQRIHFVTHSMGAILVRYFLSHHKLDELGHVVMLSPPNKGSEVVDKLGKIPGFYAFNGPAGQQLGTSRDSLPNLLGPADYPVGVITGNRSVNPFLSMLIPGENDGKVSVERARLEGMKDFMIVPSAHPMIMNNDEIIRQTKSFLRRGVFCRHRAVPEKGACVGFQYKN